MKFLKIGISNSGGNVLPYDSKNTLSSDSLNFITSCEGQIIKWDDPIEKEAINLVVTWELALKHDNGIKVWDKTHSQHYRIIDKETPAIDTDIDTLVNESYSDFRTYLENEGVDPEAFILPLDSAKIQLIRIHLLEVCNPEIQS